MTISKIKSYIEYLPILSGVTSLCYEELLKFSDCLNECNVQSQLIKRRDYKYILKQIFKGLRKDYKNALAMQSDVATVESLASDDVQAVPVVASVLATTSPTTALTVVAEKTTSVVVQSDSQVSVSE